MSSTEVRNQFSLCNLTNLAPISISVYTRLEHFKQCIESLRSNRLASESILYVFSDAAKPGDEYAVRAVREYAESITGFKEVALRYRESNGRVENMRDAREIPLFNHGRIICLEDDNIVSPHFLDFMNESLEYYESEPSILGVSGYSPPIDQERYVSDDVYLSHFWSGWTYAAWQHKSITDYLSQDKPYADMLENKLESRVRRLHPKLHLALKKMDEGTHIAGDQKLSYYMIKHAIYQLRPTKSLVKNIGHDGSGVNCRTSDRFGIEPYAGRLNVALRKLRYLPVLDHLQYRYFHQNENIAKRVARKIWRIINKKSSSLK